MNKRQRGSAFWGLIVGILVGLLVGILTAVSVSKVPVPFVNKELMRTDINDFYERVRNEKWDPNAPLYSKGGATKLPAIPAAPQPAASVVVSAVISLDVDPDALTVGRDHGDPYEYFIQAGAFDVSGEAEAMKAKILGAGYPSRIVERGVGAARKYAVRVGPIGARSEAEDLKLDMDSAGCRCSLVRVER